MGTKSAKIAHRNQAQIPRPVEIISEVNTRTEISTRSCPPTRTEEH